MCIARPFKSGSEFIAQHSPCKLQRTTSVLQKTGGVYIFCTMATARDCQASILTKDCKTGQIPDMLQLDLSKDCDFIMFLDLHICFV
jgi:hypothetical protein